MTWPRCCRNSLLVYGSHHVLYKQCSTAMRGQLGGDLPRDLFVARGGFRIIEEPTFLTEFRNPQLRTRLLFIPPQFSRTHTQEATNPKNLEKDGSITSSISVFFPVPSQKCHCYSSLFQANSFENPLQNGSHKEADV